MKTAVLLWFCMFLLVSSADAGIWLSRSHGWFAAFWKRTKNLASMQALTVFAMLWAQSKGQLGSQSPSFLCLFWASLCTTSSVLVQVFCNVFLSHVHYTSAKNRSNLFCLVSNHRKTNIHAEVCNQFKRDRYGSLDVWASANSTMLADVACPHDHKALITLESVCLKFKELDVRAKQLTLRFKHKSRTLAKQC